jgi:hypothetical protein
MRHRSSSLAEAIHKRLKWALIISSLLVISNVVAIVAMGPEIIFMAPETQGTFNHDCQKTREPIA